MYRQELAFWLENEESILQLNMTELVLSLHPSAVTEWGRSRPSGEGLSGTPPKRTRTERTNRCPARQHE